MFPLYTLTGQEAPRFESTNQRRFRHTNLFLLWRFWAVAGAPHSSPMEL